VNPQVPFVHPTAVVEPGAAVGDGTTIWHHSQLRTGSRVGSGCTLGKNVFVDEAVRIGDRVKIQNNVSVYRGVELGDDVFIGPSAVFTNDLRPRADAAAWPVRATSVRRGASVGANATVLCGIEIGEYAMVGAGAVVTDSVLPHQLVVGSPARHRAWVCRCGEIVSRASARPADPDCPPCRAAARTGQAGTAATAPTAAAAPVPCSEDRIRLAKVRIGPAEEDAVLAVLRSGMLAGGSRVAELERAFASVHGAAHAVAVSNGTIALVAALRAHRIGPGDEVITTPLTFVATLNAILEVGATARFADITDDMTVDPAQLAALITPRTRALLPVHLYGLPAAMTEISELAAARGLAVIEDAAQAHGARVGTAAVGSSGTATFSFYGTKNITCGEGGIVTTSDDEIADRLRLLRNHGMRAIYDYELPGYNYRLTDLQAAVAAVQLARLPSINESRARNAARLTAGLSGLPGLVLPAVPPGRLHVWHQYVVQVTAAAPVDRDQLGKRLDAEGIDSRPYYPALVHDYPCYRGHPQVAADATPRAGRAVREVLALPVHPLLTPDDIDRIVSCVRASLTDI
jgi:dTDP-4-amino-4,6-dideoxygalactose transaminase/acetyltransferase-like isoleucine patch superfamily enzyme